MNALTKTLSISAVTVALASGVGFAYAQSQGTTGDPLINPDPNATLSTPTASGMTQSPSQGRTAGEGVESNTTYGHSRESNNINNNAPSSDNMNNAPAQPGVAGDGVRSNNTYGNTRDFNSMNNSSGGTANDGLNTPAANDVNAAPVERAPRADRN